jgi:hypothetical protein
MFERNDVFLEVLLREREAWVSRLAAERAALAHGSRGRAHSLRERLGFSLIQAGRALLRHQPGYAPARRRLAA